MQITQELYTTFIITIWQWERYCICKSIIKLTCHVGGKFANGRPTVKPAGHGGPASCRPAGIRWISFNFPLKPLQIRLEASLGLRKAFKKPTGIVKYLSRISETSESRGGPKIDSKTSKKQCPKKGVDDEIGSCWLRIHQKLMQMDHFPHPNDDF